jgi:hypothetical protein
VAALAACSKSGDAAADGGSASTTTAAAAGKKPKATLKLADVKSAYAAEFNDMSKMKVPMDQKVAALVAKLGKPSADTGRKKTWYALDGAKCSKVDLDTKDGSIEDATTDNSDCGL